MDKAKANTAPDDLRDLLLKNRELTLHFIEHVQEQKLLSEAEVTKIEKELKRI